MPRKAKALWGFFFAAGLRAARLRRVKFMPTVAQRLWGLFCSLVRPSPYAPLALRRDRLAMTLVSVCLRALRCREITSPAWLVGGFLLYDRAAAMRNKSLYAIRSLSQTPLRAHLCQFFGGL